jgi:lipoprotein NlpD
MIDMGTVSVRKILGPIFTGRKLFLVAKKPQKPIKVIKNKSIPKKGTQKISGIAKSNAKKTLASTKKQAYGKKVTTKKIVRKVISQSTFSKKMSGWQWPVKGKITEYFSNKIQGNKGINIGGRRNTQIKAAAKGMVVYAGDALRGYGKLIIIKHNEDYLSAYAHNEKILVKENQRIKLGDVIAKMGSTGASSVMLHFEVRFRGKSVDPLKYLPKR